MSHCTEIFLKKIQQELDCAENISFLGITQMYKEFYTFCENGYLKKEDVKPFTNCMVMFIKCINCYIESNLLTTKASNRDLKHFCGILNGASKIIGINDYYVTKVTVSILEIITASVVKIWFGRELLLNVNKLLQNYKHDLRNIIAAQYRVYLSRLVHLSCICGDYEYQISIMEIIFRLCSTDQINEYAHKFFPNAGTLKNAFYKIRKDNFDQDIREFLNIMNSRFRRVLSIKCEKALLGNLTINAPTDPEGTELWIDFNTGSKTISILCNIDIPETITTSSRKNICCEWESITINCADVDNISHSETLVDNSGLSHGSAVTFNLKEPYTILSTSSQDAVQATELQLIFWTSSELDLLINNILPLMFSGKSMKPVQLFDAEQLKKPGSERNAKKMKGASAVNQRRISPLTLSISSLKMANRKSILQQPSSHIIKSSRIPVLSYSPQKMQISKAKQLNESTKVEDNISSSMETAEKCTSTSQRKISTSHEFSATKICSQKVPGNQQKITNTEEDNTKETTDDTIYKRSKSVSSEDLPRILEFKKVKDKFQSALNHTSKDEINSRHSECFSSSNHGNRRKTMESKIKKNNNHKEKLKCIQTNQLFTNSKNDNVVHSLDSSVNSQSKECFINTNEIRYENSKRSKSHNRELQQPSLKENKLEVQNIYKASSNLEHVEGTSLHLQSNNNAQFMQFNYPKQNISLHHENILQLKKNSLQKTNSLSQSTHELQKINLDRNKVNLPVSRLIAKNAGLILNSNIRNKNVEIVLPEAESNSSKKPTQGETPLQTDELISESVPNPNSECSAKVVNINKDNKDSNKEKKVKAIKGTKRRNIRKLFNPNDLSYLHNYSTNGVTATNVSYIKEPTIFKNSGKAMPPKNRKFNVRRKSPSSTPECESFKTVVTTAVIEPLPKHLRGNAEPIKEKIRKPITRAATRKKIMPDYDAIKILELSVSKSNDNHGQEKRPINLPKTLTQFQETLRRERTEVPQNILNKENNNPNSNQSNLKKTVISTKPVTKKTRNAVAKTKLNRNKKSRMSSSKNTDLTYEDFISEEQNYKTSTFKDVVTNSKNYAFDSLMDSFMKTLKSNKACTKGNRMQRQKSKKNTGVIRSNKRFSNKVPRIDTVMRHAAQADAGYESIYSDDDMPNSTKRKVTTLINRESTAKLKCPKKSDVNQKTMPSYVRRLSSYSSSIFSDLQIEVEKPNPKLIEVRLSDSESDTLKQCQFSKKINILHDVVIKPPKELMLRQEPGYSSLGGSVVTLSPNPKLNAKDPPLNDTISEDIFNISTSEIMTELIPQNKTCRESLAETRRGITNPSSSSLMYNVTYSDKPLVRQSSQIQFQNEPIRSWIATGLPTEQVQIVKETIDVLLNSYAAVARTYLELLRGAVQPELVPAYEILFKLDHEMTNYLEKQ